MLLKDSCSPNSQQGIFSKSSSRSTVKVSSESKIPMNGSMGRVRIWKPTNLPYKSTIHVGKYTVRPMDGTGYLATSPAVVFWIDFYVDSLSPSSLHNCKQSWPWIASF